MLGRKEMASIHGSMAWAIGEAPGNPSIQDVTIVAGSCFYTLTNV